MKRKGTENNTPKVGSVTKRGYKTRRGYKTNQESGYSDGWKEKKSEGFLWELR